MKIAVRRDKYLDVYALLLYIIMTFMLCFRFGSTDYFAYEAMFYSMKSFSDITSYYHGEPLFLFLCFVFNYFVGDFRIFAAVISFAQMAMLWHFIRMRSAGKIISVLIMMQVTYMFYCGPSRQGLAMSIFLCFGLELAENRQWVKYFMLCFMLTFIHYVSVIYFAVPFVLKFNVRFMLCSIPFCIIVSTLILRRVGAGIVPYFHTGIRYVAAAERILSCTMIYVIYSSLRDKSKYQFMMKLYCFGIALYFLFLPFSLVASRVAACFKVLEIVLVPCLMKERGMYRQIFLCYFLVLSAVMFVHTLEADIENGGYHQDINFINYPYVSIFNAEDIYNYRQINTTFGRQELHGRL